VQVNDGYRAKDGATQASPPHLRARHAPLSLPSGPRSARIAARPPEPSLALLRDPGAPTSAPLPGSGAPLSAGAQAPGAAPGALPAATGVLAVIARPGQESAELGAVLSAFRLRGVGLTVLCLTHGEGSEVNSSCERLEVIRPWELQVAAGLLGVSSVTVADYPDGRLGHIPPASLAEHIRRAVRRSGADLLLVVDPAVAADPDIVAVTQASCLAARQDGLAVLARTVPGPGQGWPIRLGPDGPAIRARQRCAADAHGSQRILRQERAASPASGRGPDPGDDWEVVRWLVQPTVVSAGPERVSRSAQLQ
jgi:LmbE family N-acetylglucosaminyl deacetylase